MRIESLSFSSVKGFDGRQTVPIRDLTLIYGPNSSGKSSIFQCILLLKQSVSRISSTDSGILEFRSGPADLGGFKTFVHRHDVRREIGIGLTLSETDESLPYFEDTLELSSSSVYDVRTMPSRIYWKYCSEIRRRFGFAMHQKLAQCAWRTQLQRLL